MLNEHFDPEGTASWVCLDYRQSMLMGPLGQLGQSGPYWHVGLGSGGSACGGPTSRSINPAQRSQRRRQERQLIRVLRSETGIILFITVDFISSSRRWSGHFIFSSIDGASRESCVMLNWRIPLLLAVLYGRSAGFIQAAGFWKLGLGLLQYCTVVAGPF